MGLPVLPLAEPKQKAGNLGDTVCIRGSASKRMEQHRGGWGNASGGNGVQEIGHNTALLQADRLAYHAALMEFLVAIGLCGALGLIRPTCIS